MDVAIKVKGLRVVLVAALLLLLVADCGDDTGKDTGGLTILRTSVSGG